MGKTIDSISKIMASSELPKLVTSLELPLDSAVSAVTAIQNPLFDSEKQNSSRSLSFGNTIPFFAEQNVNQSKCMQVLVSDIWTEYISQYLHESGLNSPIAMCNKLFRGQCCSGAKRIRIRMSAGFDSLVLHRFTNLQLIEIIWQNFFKITAKCDTSESPLDLFKLINVVDVISNFDKSENISHQEILAIRDQIIKISKVNVSIALQMYCATSDDISKTVRDFENCKELHALNLESSPITRIELTSSIQDLNLRSCVGLGDVSILGTFSSLRKIDLSCTKIENLPVLFGLEELTLHQCTNIRNFSPLERCVKLRCLDVSQSNIRELPFCAGMQELNISNCKLTKYSILELYNHLKVLKACHTDMQTIPKLSQIESLDLTGCTQIKRQSFGKLSTFPRLTKLNLSLTRISILPTCVSVEELNLHGCVRVKNYSALAEYGALKVLNLSCSNISTIPICPLVTSLNLEECNRVKAFSVLEQFTKLEELNLADTRIKILPTCSGLKTLNLFHCRKLSQYELLEQFTALEQLNLSGTRISTIPSIPSIRDLNVSDCVSIVDFTILETFKRLKILDLSWTKVSELPQCESVEYLHIDNCQQLIDLNALSTFKNLKGIGADIRLVNYPNFPGFTKELIHRWDATESLNRSCEYSILF